MRPLEEARREVLDALDRLPIVEVPVDEALGLVLAEEVRASEPVPPFDNSAMDGYAVRAADVAEVPAVLTVLEDVPAGHVARGRVEPGTAIKIMTGAPLPAGADAVVPVEQTAEVDGGVRIEATVEPGTNVRRAGGDVAAGELVFGAGERLTPMHVGVLASLGVRPRVRRRPLVAVMSTGDEVMPSDTPRLAPGQIRDSNRPLLKGMLEELGVDILDLGIVPDDEDALLTALEKAASEADAVMTSGGVSMGEYDLIKTLLRRLGRVEFWQVAMQPAKPFAFGFLGDTPFFGLPGNPVSVMVAFEQFGRPGLLHMMGANRVLRPRVMGVLTEDVRTNPAKTVFLRVEARWEDGRWVARLSGGQLSNMLAAAARANAFAVVPVGVGDVHAGETVELEMFRWPEDRPAEGNA